MEGTFLRDHQRWNRQCRAMYEIRVFGHAAHDECAEGQKFLRHCRARKINDFAGFS
jgi:hypothetical protein